MARPLELDVVGNGVREEESELEVNLGDQQGQESEGVVGLPYRGHVGCDAQLSDGYGASTNVLGEGREGGKGGGMGGEGVRIGVGEGVVHP